MVHPGGSQAAPEAAAADADRPKTSPTIVRACRFCASRSDLFVIVLDEIEKYGYACSSFAAGV